MATLGLASLAVAQAPTETEEVASAERTPDLETRLRELSSAPDAQRVERLLSQARRALTVATERRQAGSPGGAARAQRIARAAIHLAERRLALFREREALAAAHRRRREIRLLLEDARRALEAAAEPAPRNEESNAGS
ncbi:MAG: hypothetical protein AAGF12_12635 [Myxococcota bacterium]